MGGHDQQDKYGGSREDAERHRDKKHKDKKSRHRDSSRSKSGRDSDESRHRSGSDEPRQKSPDHHDRNEIIGSDGTHAASSTGFTRDAPAPNDNEAGPSQDGDVNKGKDDRLGELYNMMGTLVARMNNMEQNRAPADHSMSDYDEDGPDYGETSGIGGDAMDHLSVIFDNPVDENKGKSDTNVDMLKALADLAGGFSTKEEMGPPMHTGYATVLNDTLRGRPNEAQLKPVLQDIKFPENVPNLTVPSTNADVLKALPSNGRLLDTQMFKTNALIAKALVPIASLVADIGEGKVQNCGGHFQGLNSSVRLLTAAFCYINQSRKDVARMYIRESTLPGLCKWDSPVGEKDLFPFDVTKRCDELGKVRTLGSHTANQQNRPRYHHKKPTSELKWPPRRYENKPAAATYSAPYPNKGRGKATSNNNKPFLGKRSNDRFKKKY